MRAGILKADWLIWLGGIGAVAGIGCLVWLNHRPSRHTAVVAAPSFPLPPFSETRYRNAGPDAKFIGAAACAECHRSKHASYLLTAHSAALADLDPTAEPPDGTFEHTLSSRTYRVYRRGDQFRQQEVLHTDQGKEIARVDLPVRYVIGSGHFSRSYLVEVDGFLFESPITWYTQKHKWEMSPGYDFAGHPSFDRLVGVACLGCHAGRVEPGETTTRVSLREKAIGCESCHGPGSLHADLQRTHKTAPGEEDLTIVHPGRLSRERLEAVCAICHLTGATAIPLRGRKYNDFHPGLPLTDYRVDYRFDTESDQMTVTGHIEQLRLSACYQKSADLTCVTCHDPHAKEKPKDTVAFYRQKCLACHETQGCRLELARRLQKQPGDNCVACHMPRGDTDIPHIAFTHHRIGKHGGARPPSPSERVPALVPIDDILHLPAIDRDRNLGLAYSVIADNPQHYRYADVFRERARNLLESVYAAGLREAQTTQALATVCWKRDQARANAYADEALQASDLSIDSRVAALVIRADGLVKEGKIPAAITMLEEVVRLRRNAEDWRVLGELYLKQNQPQKALAALQQAFAIRPYRHDIQGALGEAYRQTGDSARAREYTERAQWLLDHRQQ